MKRGFQIWGILTLVVWVAAMVKALMTDTLSLQYVGYTLPMAAVLTVFVAIVIEVVLVVLKVGQKPAQQ